MGRIMLYGIYSEMDDYRQNLLNNSDRGETARDIKSWHVSSSRRLTQIQVDNRKHTTEGRRNT
jgi:hypothetical protein